MSAGDKSTTSEPLPMIFRCPSRAHERVVVRRDFTRERVWQEPKGATSYPIRLATRYFDERGERVRAPFHACPVCGAAMKGTDIKGRQVDRKCDARCMGAVGSGCDCSCGGANHGGDFRPA